MHTNYANAFKNFISLQNMDLVDISHCKIRPDRIYLITKLDMSQLINMDLKMDLIDTYHCKI